MTPIEGLDKRSHFASLFLAGYVANPQYVGNSQWVLADMALKQADILLQKIKETPDRHPHLDPMEVA